MVFYYSTNILNTFSFLGVLTNLLKYDGLCVNIDLDNVFSFKRILFFFIADWVLL